MNQFEQRHCDSIAKIAFVLWLVFSLTFLFVGLEWFLDWSIDHPLSERWRRVAKTFYDFDERDIIHLDPRCSRHDEQNTYLLKPPGCEFRNREFDTHLTVNSFGLRGSENDLNAPEIIVLGDSFSLGWGVEDDESFSSIIGKKTGKKILNAAVSSYGTVRELRLLERLDRSNIKTIILQYSRNDKMENESFLQVPSTFSPMGREQYEALMKGFQSDIRYYPGRTILKFLPRLRESYLESYPPKANEEDGVLEAALFAQVLEKLLDVRSPTRVLVTEIDEGNSYSRSFEHALRTQHLPRLSTKLGVKLEFVNVTNNLAEEDWYRLDGHLKPSGHEKIATTFIEAGVGE